MNMSETQRGAVMYIPPGFNTVTPYFYVENAEAFVSFLINALDGTETCRGPCTLTTGWASRAKSFAVC